MEYKYDIEPMEKAKGLMVAVDEEQELPRATGELVFKALEVGIIPYAINFEVSEQLKWVVTLWGDS